MRLWLALGGANALMAVAMGAFAAHGLERAGAPDAVAWVETGARYQLGHGLALMLVAVLSGVAELRSRLSGPWLAVAGWAFLAGCLLFSAGLYAMALSGLGAIAAVVPIGGVGFLTGWAALVAAAVAGPRRAERCGGSPPSG